MAKQKISAQRKYEIGTLFDYKLQDVMLPPTLDPVIYPQMNLNTAKAWFQVLSIIQETTSDDIEAGIVSYTFPALDFAKRMNMSQPRGESVRNALKPLTKIDYTSVSGDLDDIENARILDTSLLMAVQYHGNSPGKPLIIYLHPEVNSLIYETKKAIHFDYEDAAKLTSITSIHVFTALTRLKSKGIVELPLDKFKEAIGLTGKYPIFYDFKKRILLPAERDIQTNTSFKSFHFLYDGQAEPATGKRAAVKNIGFSFDAPNSLVTVELPSFSDFLDYEDSKKLSSLDVMTQEVIMELCKKQYSVAKYLNLILKAISETSESDFRICCQRIMLEAGQDLLNEKYGKILTKNLKELPKKHLSHAADRKVDVNKIAYSDQQKWLETWQKRAKALITAMPLERRIKIVEENRLEIISQVCDKNKYNERDLLSLKLDCRKTAVKALIAFLSRQYYTGNRKFDDDMRWVKDSLFAD